MGAAHPNLTPSAVALYNEQARRLEERKRRRPLGKTTLFGGLLYALNPFGGTGIGHIYVYTRNKPAEFRFWEAFVSGWVSLFCFLITLALVIGVIWLFGGVTGFIEDGRIEEIQLYINHLLQRR